MILSKDELRQAQLLMLKILKEIHRVCEENNIQYFLSDGTLLGAVRHNGFIPWDDDLDIGMMREDYDKFCKIANSKFSEDFFLQSNKTDSNYYLSYAKVVLRNTLWVENGTKTSDIKCLYVDIFPYDKVPQKNEIKLKKHFTIFRLINFFLLSKYGLRKLSKSDKSFFIKKLIIILFPKKLLILYRNHLMTKYKKLSSFNITKYGGNLYRNLNEGNVFNSFILHKFEDHEFYIPQNFKVILTNLYGNYMELPPVEKRVSHEILDYNFDSAKL